MREDPHRTFPLQLCPHDLFCVAGPVHSNGEVG